jgi:hypothetical protein
LESALLSNEKVVKIPVTICMTLGVDIKAWQQASRTSLKRRQHQKKKKLMRFSAEYPHLITGTGTGTSNAYKSLVLRLEQFLKHRKPK